MTYDQLQHKKILEALLFASAEPLSLRTLSDYVPECENIEDLLSELAQEYEGRGIILKKIQDKSTSLWAFRTSPDLAESLSLSQEVQRQPSRAAMETLAIIAYHQPITRTEIETIRGVATSKGTFDTLIEAGWVKPGRRKESPGRPLTWVTTSDFLDHFNLSSIKELPGVKELQSAGLLDSRPAMDALPESQELFEKDISSEHNDSLDAEDESDHNAETSNSNKRAAS